MPCRAVTLQLKAVNDNPVGKMTVVFSEDDSLNNVTVLSLSRKKEIQTTVKKSFDVVTWHDIHDNATLITLPMKTDTDALVST